MLQVVSTPAVDQERYAQLATSARAAFQRQWLTQVPEQQQQGQQESCEVHGPHEPGTGRRPRYELGAGSQCAHVLALAFGLLEGAPAGAEVRRVCCAIRTRACTYTYTYACMMGIGAHWRTGPACHLTTCVRAMSCS